MALSWPCLMSKLIPVRTPLCAAAITVALFAAVVGGCEDDADKRRGGEGESCTTTDDCQSPLKCYEHVCSHDPAAGGGGSTSTSSGGTGGTSTTTSSGGTGGSAGSGGTAAGGSGGLGGIGPGDSVNACDDCLDDHCAAELAACGSACVGVEACIETICRALSETSEESQCFVHCQGANPGGQQPHLDVVNCAYDGACFPPCQGYPIDYPACRNYMTTGPCAAEWAACQSDVDCQLYQNCSSGCTTFSGCINCASTPEGLAGRELYEAYEFCVATECLSESWL